ncbi:hypothetical protein HDE_10330 [Halotydeus destructor]|nr:hypothetical protein HDE_10330 [Halotydeus destructor]
MVATMLLLRTSRNMSKANCVFNLLTKRTTLVRPFLCRAIQSSNGGGPKKAGGHDMPPGNPEFGGDASVFQNPDTIKRPVGPKTVDDFADLAKTKHWVSYGFDAVYYKEDRYQAHFAFFMCVTCLLVGFSFLLYYYPDIKLDNWATREAYLEISRRKSLGLPLVDRNYVDPARIVLPTEEELGDTEVII